jgi:hypothetical protein
MIFLLRTCNDEWRYTSHVKSNAPTVDVGVEGKITAEDDEPVNKVEHDDCKHWSSAILERVLISARESAKRNFVASFGLPESGTGQTSANDDDEVICP